MPSFSIALLAVALAAVSCARNGSASGGFADARASAASPMDTPLLASNGFEINKLPDGQDSVPLPVALASPPSVLTNPKRWTVDWSSAIDPVPQDGGEFQMSFAEDADTVYLIHNGRLNAVDAATGATRWVAGHGLHGSPVASADGVFAATATGVVAISRTGDERWARNLPIPESMPAPTIAADRGQIFASYLSRGGPSGVEWFLAAVSAADGSPQWTSKSPTGLMLSRAYPFEKTVAVVATTDGAILGTDLCFFNRSTGALGWTIRNAGAIIGRRGDLVYAADSFPTPDQWYDPHALDEINASNGAASIDLDYFPDLRPNAIIKNPPPTDEWIVGDDLWIAGSGNIYRYSLLRSPDEQRPARVVDAHTPGIGGGYDGRPKGALIYGYPRLPGHFHVAGPFADALVVDTTNALWILRLRSDGGSAILRVMDGSAEVQATAFYDRHAYVGLADGRIIDIRLASAAAQAAARTNCRGITRMVANSRGLLVQCGSNDSNSEQMIVRLGLP